MSVCGREHGGRNPPTQIEPAASPPSSHPNWGGGCGTFPFSGVRQEVRPAAALWFPVSPSHILPHQVEGGGGGAEGQRCRPSPPWPPLSRPPHAPPPPPPPVNGESVSVGNRAALSLVEVLIVGGNSQRRQRKGPVLEQFSVPHQPHTQAGPCHPSLLGHVCTGLSSVLPLGSQWALPGILNLLPALSF